MDVHEGAEILARLGILESKEESPTRKKDDSFVDVKFADSDSDSGADVVFDRNALMSSRSRRRGSRRSRAACCIFAESSIFAIFIICFALFTTGFTLNASPNVYNLIESPSFTLHFIVQTIGMLAGILMGRRLVGMMSFTSIITLCTVLGLGCTLSLLLSPTTPAIAVLFVRAFAATIVQYCSVSLILAFWRGHRRKLIVLFVCFTLGAMLAPSTATSRLDAVAKRDANANKSNSPSFPQPAALDGAASTDSAHVIWDWSGEATLRGGDSGTTANWAAVFVTTVSLVLLLVTYLVSCRCGVPIDARVHRLREVEEFTPLSIGFRIRLATLQVILGAVFTLCEWSRVVADERREALAVQLIVLLAAFAAGDRLLSLTGLCTLLAVGAVTSLLSLLDILTSVTHAALFSSSALSLIYLPLLIDKRVTPRPLLTVDLLMGWPIVSRLILPLALATPALPKGLLVFFLCAAAAAMMLPMTRSLHKTERVLISSLDPEKPDPKMLSHRPLTKDDYSALINAIDEESDEESSV